MILIQGSVVIQGSCNDPVGVFLRWQCFSPVTG